MGKLFLADNTFTEVSVKAPKKSRAKGGARDEDFDFIFIDKRDPENLNASNVAFTTPWYGSRAAMNRYDVALSIGGVSLRMKGEDFLNLMERMQKAIEVVL